MTFYRCFLITLIKLVKKLEEENVGLSSKNEVLEAKLNNVLERFARWQFNLSKMDGVDLNKLDQGLPAKNRD